MTSHDLSAKTNGQVPTQAAPLASAAASGWAEEHEIAVVQIKPEDNARKYFDPEETQALADNIAAHGLINAVIAYRDPQTGLYRLIGGERRWRAVQLLGWKTVRVRVLREPPDDAKRRELALIDNEREDLSDIERGMAYLEYMTCAGCTASALAQKIGKHVSTVTRAVGLVRKLPEDLREAIGPKLPPTIAGMLTPLPDDDAKRHFAGLYREGKIKTGKELAAAIRAARNGQAAGGTAGFTVVEAGIRIACTWNSGGADAQALAAVENALRVVLKDLGGQKHRGLEHWKKFLEKKAKAVAAQNELAGLGNPAPSAPPPAPKEG